MKRTLTLAVLLLSGAILASCGTTSTSSQNNSSATQESVTSQNPEFADYLSNHKTIVYDLVNSESISKESRILYLLVVDDNKVTTYNLKDATDSDSLTLGDVSKLSDDEIIKKATELHKRTVENNYNQTIENLKGDLEFTQNEIDTYKDNLSKYPEGAVGIANGSLEDHEKRVENLNKIISSLENTKDLTDVSKPSSGAYSIDLTTDGSGNQTSFEYFTYSARLYDKDTSDVDLTNPLKSYFPTTDNNGFGVTRFYSTDIYDSTYNIGVNKDNKNTIAIRTDKNVIFNLDSPKTKLKNVTVD